MTEAMRSKPKRTTDAKLLEVVRRLPCMGCVTGPVDPTPSEKPRSHPHHVISRGAGGPDVPENLLPLCAGHHQRVHAIGLTSFAAEKPLVKGWLEGAGWLFDTKRNRWRPPFEVHR